MIRVLTETPRELSEFRPPPWRFQLSYVTPVKDLHRFVATLLRQYSLAGGVLSTDQVVFEPRTVIRFLGRYSLKLENPYGFIVESNDQVEVAGLLEAVLSDWVDFLFIPHPILFAMYTDHDEYTTFHAPSEEELNKLITPLKSAGFEQVQNYFRPPLG